MKQHIHSLRICQTLLVVVLLGHAQITQAFGLQIHVGNTQLDYSPPCPSCPSSRETANNVDANQAPQIQKTTTRLSQGFVHLRSEVIKQRQARSTCNAASGTNGLGCTQP